MTNKHVVPNGRHAKHQHPRLFVGDSALVGFADGHSVVGRPGRLVVIRQRRYPAVVIVMPKVTDTTGRSTPIEDASLAMLSDHALSLFLDAAEREERDISDRRALAEPSRHERAITANLLYLHQRIIEIRLEKNRRVDRVPPQYESDLGRREIGKTAKSPDPPATTSNAEVSGVVSTPPSLNSFSVEVQCGHVPSRHFRDRTTGCNFEECS